MPTRSFVQGTALVAALVLAAAPSRAERSASFVDYAGAPYTVTLRGPGQFEVVENATIKGQLDSLVLTGTTSASRLSIIVGATSEGPGNVDLRSFQCAGPLREFHAPRCSAGGAGMDFAGGVDSIVMGEITADVTVGDGGRSGFPRLRMKTGEISQGATVSCPTLTLDLVARQVNGATIVAHEVTRMKAGEFSGTLRSATRIGPVRIGGTGGGLQYGVFTAREIASIDVRRDRDSDGTLGGGTIAKFVVAALKIGPVRAAAQMNHVRILAGTQLGEDAALGGTGADADTVQAGTLGPVTVGGDMEDTVLGAGLASVDGTFGNGDDGVYGGAASRMGPVTIGLSINTCFFGAGRFGPVRVERQLLRRSDSPSSFITQPLP